MLRLLLYAIFVIICLVLIVAMKKKMNSKWTIVPILLLAHQATYSVLWGGMTILANQTTLVPEVIKLRDFLLRFDTLKFLLIIIALYCVIRKLKHITGQGTVLRAGDGSQS